MVYGLRVVPAGRAAGIAYGRTLRVGESDDGRRVHVRPGESLAFAPGSLAIALDAIDDYYRHVDPDRPEGSLATALRVWFGVASDVTDEARRLLGAAAHRFDAAQHLLGRAATVRASFEDDSDLGGPRLIVKADELIHLVQEGIVALGRSLALIRKGIEICSYEIDESAVIAASESAIKAVRDAYEHIDERAAGRLRGGVDDDRAYTIFNHDTLLQHGVIEYMEHRLDLAELPAILDACRATIKALAGGPPSLEPESN
jgi:hypothetical protein